MNRELIVENHYEKFQPENTDLNHEQVFSIPDFQLLFNPSLFFSYCDH